MSSFETQSSTVSFSSSQPQYSSQKTYQASITPSFPEEQYSHETQFKDVLKRQSYSSSHILSSNIQDTSSLYQSDQKDNSNSTKIGESTDINQKGSSTSSSARTIIFSYEEDEIISEKLSSISSASKSKDLSDTQEEQDLSPIGNKSDGIDSTPTMDDSSGEQNPNTVVQQTPEIHLNPQVYQQLVQETVQSSVNNWLKGSLKNQQAGPLVQKLRQALVVLENNKSNIQQSNDLQSYLQQSQYNSQNIKNLKPLIYLEYSSVEEYYQAQERFYKYKIVEPPIDIISPDFIENDLKIIKLVGGIMRLYFMDEQTYFVGFLE